MKRKWRKVQNPGWLGAVGQKLGIILEEQVAQNVEHMVFSGDCKASDPLLRSMVIGHWIVGQLAFMNKRKPKQVHICCSQCGVIAGYEPWEIAAGRLPKTCYGCRPGEHAPPITRVIPECDLPKLKLHWNEEYIMATAFEEKMLSAAPAIQELWNTQGRPVMQEIVNRTRYGAAFGWKVTVHGFTNLKHARPKQHRVKIQAIYKGERRLEMFVQHKAGNAGFTASLFTGRSDVTFGDIVNEVEKAVKILQSLDTEGNFPDNTLVAAAATNGKPELNGHAGPIDLSKLLKIRAGLDNLLAVGNDVNEITVMKEAARKKVEATDAMKGDFHVAKVKAEEADKAAKAKYKAAQEIVARCEMQLRNALAAAENAMVDEQKAAQGVLHAIELYKPVEEAAAAAEKELAEIEALEMDRLKSVGDTKGMAALLEALAHIGG